MSRLSEDSFVELFHRHFHRLFRYLDRLCGEPDLAADLAQDAFLRLYERGSVPDRPEAWLVAVGSNLLRNARGKSARRARLLPFAAPAAAVAWNEAVGEVVKDDAQRRVRESLTRLSERDRRLLLMRAEGFAYREIAEALGLNETSIGTLLARAKQAFLESYEGRTDAPR